jgi:hypothetical protein
MVRGDMVRFSFHHFSYRRTYHAGIFGLICPVQTTRDMAGASSNRFQLRVV